MAKKLPQNEQPYEPVKAALVDSVLRPLAPKRNDEPAAPKLAVVPSPAAREQASVASAAPEPARQPERREPAERSETTGAEALERERPKQQFTGRQTRALDAERLTREKRCLLTRVEETELEALVQRVAHELHTSVKTSHVLRAAIQVIRHAEEEIISAARQMGPLSRPANSDATKLAEFELHVATLLSTALRRAPPLRG